MAFCCGVGRDVRVNRRASASYNSGGDRVNKLKYNCWFTNKPTNSDH